MVSVACAEDLHAPERLFATAARAEIVAGSHLVLQATNIGVGRSQFSRRQALVQHLVNGVLGLQQGPRRIILRCAIIVLVSLLGFARLALRREVVDARQRVLHLGNGIIFQDDDQLLILLGLLQALRLAAIIVL